jgi:hypothetical protein
MQLQGLLRYDAKRGKVGLRRGLGHAEQLLFYPNRPLPHPKIGRTIRRTLLGSPYPHLLLVLQPPVTFTSHRNTKPSRRAGKLVIY